MSAPADPMAGMRALGRFLITGVAAGGVIGGLCGALVMYDDGSDYWVGGLTIGVMLGIAIGTVLQGVVYSLFLAVRRHAQESGRSTLTAITLPLAAAAACGVSAALGVDGPKLVTVVAVTALLGSASVIMTARWCLAPLSTSESQALLAR